MKNKLLMVVLMLVALTCSMAAAAPVKLKYIGSIYTDAEGIPLRHPAGVTITGETLLIADSGGKRILTFSMKGETVTQDKIISLPKMFPLMVQKATSGDFYVLDGRERKIIVLSPSGQIKGDFEIKDLPGEQRIIPRSIRLTADGRLLVLDIFSARVLLISESSQFQRQIKFPQEYGAFSDLAMDAQGTIYLLDSVAGAIFTAGPNAETFSLWSTGLKEYTNFPSSLVVTSQGSVIMVDKHGSGLAVLGLDGSFSGRRLSMGWNDAQLYYPSQISINDNGHIFIADTENHRIQQFNIEQ